MNRGGLRWTSDIRTTAGEGVYRAVRIGPVEAWDDGALSVREAFGQLFIGFLGQECTILVKEDYLGCIDELIAQVMGHDELPFKYSTAGSCVIAAFFAISFPRWS